MLEYATTLYTVPMTPEQASLFGAVWLATLAGFWLFGLIGKLKAPEMPRG